MSSKILFIVEEEKVSYRNNHFYNNRLYAYFELTREELKNLFKTGKWFSIWFSDKYIKLFELPNGLLVNSDFKKFLKGNDDMVFKLESDCNGAYYIHPDHVDKYTGDFYRVYQVRKRV